MTTPGLTELGRAPDGVAATYKGREVESLLDIYFYRRVGFQLARLSARIRLTPAGVTVCGGFLGVLAGHFYYYPSLALNGIGMLLHVASNACDNADGQLARMTGQGSRSGRVLDGLVDNLVFASVYAHLCLRYVAEGGTIWVWALALVAGASHSLQSSAADYFRNLYLWLTAGEQRAEFDSSVEVERAFHRLSWRDQPWTKFLFRLYLNYTQQQEWLAPDVVKLRNQSGPDEAYASAAYQRASRSMIRWWNLLATNSRMIILFALLLVRRPVWYFVAEVSIFNLLLIVLLRRQNAVADRLLVRDSLS